jgi:hypothetical protein
LGEQKGKNMIQLRAPQGTIAMEWNGKELKVDKKGMVTAPDEALCDLLAHGCTASQEKIVVQESTGTSAE